MSGPALVGSAEAAAANIQRFASEFEKNTALQERVTLAHDWYAVRAAGRWIFGHSKFIGYDNNNAARYLAIYRDTNGGRTESRLRNWFEPVDLGTPLGRELAEALKSFLARKGRVPRKAIRINVLSSELDKVPASHAASRHADLLARISSDPGICGGRPCIRGTRMRVSDLVEMMAQGATKTEILEDFPYIFEEDIAAALAFAARAVDHRIIRAV
jgi:uncharacterized protein (DUF433 family)